MIQVAESSQGSRWVQYHQGEFAHEPVLNVFSLDEIGLDPVDFIELFRPTFQQLPWDYYDVRREQIALLQQAWGELLNEDLMHYYEHGVFSERLLKRLHRLEPEFRKKLYGITPYRRREVSRFQMVASNAGGWRIRELAIEPVSQKVERRDIRSLPRKFSPMKQEVSTLPEFQYLLKGVAQMVQEVQPWTREMSITCWQTGIVASKLRDATNSPEGIHQDGADYIVSALVMERSNITGGESIVYGPDKKTELLRVVLPPGYGIFQSDSNSPLWHNVTPIQLESTERDLGIRNLLGFDIMLD